MATRFVFNPAVLPYLAAGGAGVKDGLEERGKEVEQRAKSFCPVDTGRLRDSIDEETVVESGLVRARVGTDVEYAHWVEFGTSRTPTFAFLRRALDGG
jgi:HK97 gp10 family phage protein